MEENELSGKKNFTLENDSGILPTVSIIINLLNFEKEPETIQIWRQNQNDKRTIGITMIESSMKMN